MKYTSFFHHKDSESMVEPHATYFKPQGFDDSLHAVQNKIQELDFQHRPANATPDQMQMKNYQQ